MINKSIPVENDVTSIIKTTSIKNPRKYAVAKNTTITSATKIQPNILFVKVFINLSFN